MKWIITFIFLVIGYIIGTSLYLQPNDFLGCIEKPLVETECGKADAIVVLSGGDTRSRTAAGIDMYLNGWADYLIFSGAAYDKSGPSNAAAMRGQALAAGVPTQAILIDEDSVNTQQNAENTQGIIAENGFSDIILVTSGYHQRRASLEFKRLSDNVVVRNHPVHDRDWSWYWWLTPRGWWLTNGEMVKIIGFYLGAKA